jgi:hypothetical protein
MSISDEMLDAMLDQSNGNKVSDCCGASIVGEISGEGEDACGRCSRCKEMAGVVTEE